VHVRSIMDLRKFPHPEELSLPDRARHVEQYFRIPLEIKCDEEQAHAAMRNIHETHRHVSNTSTWTTLDLYEIR